MSRTEGRLLSLSRRLALILLGTLAVIAVLAVLLYRLQQAREAEGMAPSLPMQLAAIVELLESTPEPQQSTVLRALASPSLRLQLQAAAPVGADDAALAGLGALIRHALLPLGGRDIVVQRLPGAEERSPRSGARIIIHLKDGRYLIIDRSSGLLRTVFGGRLLLAGAALLLFIGAAAMALIRVQLRPLEQLAAAVEHFGEHPDEPPLDFRGAAEFATLAEAFNRMRQRIRALLQARARLLAAISHDLNTYLTRLRLRAEFIDDETQRLRAVRDIDDMGALLRDSLLLGRSSSVDETPLTVAPQPWLQTLLDDLGAPPDRLVLAQVPWPRAEVRPLALKRVLANLVDNACKYGGGAELRLLRLPAGGCELWVEDRGPGIPPAMRELVLEPFYRCDEARNLDVPGFGLGLSIVAEILRRYGGSLLLEDRPGGGLRVRAALGGLCSISS